MGGGVYRRVRQSGKDFSRKSLELGNAFYLVPEKLYAYGVLCRTCWEYLNNVAADAEFVSHKVYVVPLVLNAHQFCEEHFS